MGRAEELFERLKQGGERTIDAFIAEALSEEMFLDYKKSGTDPRLNSLGKDDLANFAEAVSGFGNMEGGVIIWGVRCVSDPVRGDVPDKKFPVQNPERFASWLNGLVSAVTIPAHPHVENLVILSGTSPSEGFVATFVEKSNLSPHEVVSAGKHQGHYMMRTGSSFVRMPHAVLAAFFGRRPEPVLEFSCLPELKSRDNEKDIFSVIIGIRNVGAGLARFPSMKVSLLGGGLRFNEYQLDDNGRSGLPREATVRGTPSIYIQRFIGGINDVVFPGTTKDITKVIATVGREGFSILETIMRFEYELYCEGFSALGTKEIPFRELGAYTSCSEKEW